MSTIVKAKLADLCLDRLDLILPKGRTKPDTPSIMERIFQIARETLAVHGKNYLPWNDKYLGRNNYINICSADFNGNRVVWGYNREGRSFIAFRYNVKIVAQSGSTNDFPYVALFFQGNNGDHVVLGGVGSYQFLENLTEQLEEKFKEYRTFFSGGIILDESIKGHGLKHREISLLPDSAELTSSAAK